MSDVKKIAQEQFKRIKIDTSLNEKIEAPSLTFWQDVRRRLKTNKAAIFAMVLLVIIIFFSMFGPMMNAYEYDKQIQPPSQHTKLPPKVPGLAELGILDGTVTKEVGENGLARLTEGTYEIVNEFTETKEDGTSVTRYTVVEDVYAAKGIEDEAYWFGTDDLGRDLWTRVWRGVRVSLLIGFIAAMIDLLIGVSYGAIAGFYGGKIDMYMMRFTEILTGIPNLVLVTLFILVFDPGIVPIAIAIAMTSWVGMARVVRSQFLKIKEQEFILAGRTLGTPSFKLIFKHIIPNIIGQIVIMITFSIPSAIFYESFLAFIGLGLQAPETSLGTLIADGYKFLMTNAFMLFIPAVILSVLMLSLNIFANGLRDAVDPRMRNS
ncbi:oligopeptide ABC transporter permease [Vallitalea okinawensis]|uniref:oligopeptide ABC transporter permease n=1 Tax=Vallitalea okinawensis TaxID=2078660 RepID=UPI000CFD8FCE|nr:oligopeptide ABC transporter permease [Vallitalea okinawensis]